MGEGGHAFYEEITLNLVYQNSYRTMDVNKVDIVGRRHLPAFVYNCNSSKCIQLCQHAPTLAKQRYKLVEFNV